MTASKPSKREARAAGRPTPGLLVLLGWLASVTGIGAPDIAQIPALIGTLILAFELFYAAFKEISKGLLGSSTLASLAIPVKFYEVTKYIVRNDFGFGLDKYFISAKVWNSYGAKAQQVLQETFDELEPKLYFDRVNEEAGPSYDKWEELNGAGTVLVLDAAAAQAKMAPLNKELADDVFGPGTWAKIEAA